MQTDQHPTLLAIADEVGLFFRKEPATGLECPWWGYGELGGGLFMIGRNGPPSGDFASHGETMKKVEAGDDGRRLHGEVAMRLAALEQRYTSSRRALVETLAKANRPLTTPEILQTVDRASISSTYRNLTVLCEAEVARRISGADDLGRFELAEELGGHHHHLVCSSCGTMEDVEASPKLERAIAEAARQASDDRGFQIRAHRIDFEGLCTDCLTRT